MDLATVMFSEMKESCLLHVFIKTKQNREKRSRRAKQSKEAIEWAMEKIDYEEESDRRRSNVYEYMCVNLFVRICMKYPFTFTLATGFISIQSACETSLYYIFQIQRVWDCLSVF